MRRVMLVSKRSSSCSHEQTRTMTKRRCRHFDPREAGAAISLRADRGVATTGSAVDSWTSSDPTPVVATSSGSARPTFVASSSSFGGFPALEFDGSDDVMSVTATAAGIARNRTQGWIFVSILDRNPTGGSSNHPTFVAEASIALPRFTNYTRVGSDNGSISYGMRLDTTFSNTQITPYGSGTKVVETEANWGSNYHAAWMNGLRSSTVAYPGGGGSTANTDSLGVRIGNDGATGFSPSTFTQITVFNTAIPPALAARVRHNSARTFHIACS
jgi:hypothetical protein